LALKGITIKGGVIDPDFQGEIKLIIQNSGKEAFELHPKMKIAQLLFIKFCCPSPLIVDEFSSFSDRKDKGIGSTGMF
jgi:dUTP pyrophosphatase